MSHEIETMMYVGKTPWHNLGVEVKEAPSIEQAIVLAGLDWNVALKPIFTAEGEKITDAQLCYRTSDNRQLGTVGPDYACLQNAQGFNFFNPFVQSGLASLEIAGSLRNGQRVWILAKLNKENSMIVDQANDSVAKYLLLSNSHDGTLAIRVGFTPIRVVCQNTLSMAHGSNASKLLKVRHRGDIKGTLDRIQEVVNLANSEFEATAEQYRRLAQSQCDLKTLEKYVKIVFTQKPTELKQIEVESGLVVNEENNSSRIINKILPLFEHGKGNDLPGVKGTMWAAYNAITEHIQYERGHSATSESNRLDSTWFGTGMGLNKKALSTALQLVG